MRWRARGRIGDWLRGAITPRRNAAERHLIGFRPRSLCDKSGSGQSDANAGSWHSRRARKQFTPC
ncbi:unnamed protein product [Ixodes pacificus]